MPRIAHLNKIEKYYNNLKQKYNEHICSLKGLDVKQLYEKEKEIHDIFMMMVATSTIIRIVKGEEKI